MSQMPPNSQSPAGSTQLVVVGLVIAIVAVILVNVYVELRAASEREDTFNAFQFKFPKNRGDVITEKDVELVRIPTQFGDGFGKSLIKESSPGSGTPDGGWGQELEQNVLAGEILRASMMLRQDRFSAGSEVERGYRIFPLKVNSRDQPPNLSAGNYIDVLGAFNRRSTGFSEAKVIMERIEVLRVGARLNSQDEDGSRVLRYSNISIAVKPEDVPKLMVIESAILNNEFDIVVRNKDDRALSFGDEEGQLNPEVLERLGLDN